jgi:hypothetical protein
MGVTFEYLLDFWKPPTTLEKPKKVALKRKTVKE